MKKYSFIILLTSFPFFQSLAQFAQIKSGGCFNISSKKDLDERSTHVVLTGNAEFDKQLKEYVKKYWTVNKYEINEPDYFTINRNNPDLIFLIANEIFIKDFTGDPTNQRREFLLLSGDKAYKPNKKILFLYSSGQVKMDANG